MMQIPQLIFCVVNINYEIMILSITNLVMYFTIHVDYLNGLLTEYKICFAFYQCFWKCIIRPNENKCKIRKKYRNVYRKLTMWQRINLVYNRLSHVASTLHQSPVVHWLALWFLNP